MMPGMKITSIETVVVNTGFRPPRPWHFCVIRTDEGLTGYSEFGSEGITRNTLETIEVDQTAEDAHQEDRRKRRPRRRGPDADAA